MFEVSGAYYDASVRGTGDCFVNARQTTIIPPAQVPLL